MRTPRPRCARQARITQHIPLVRRLAARMLWRAPWEVELEDLVSYGTIGLIDAIDRYDDTRDVSFPAYVRLRVQGAMLDAIRRYDPTPRSVHDRRDRLHAAERDLERRLGRPPTPAELARKLEIPEAGVHALRAGSHPNVRVPLLREDEDGEGAVEWLPDPAAGIEEELRRADLAAAVREGLLRLSPRDRVIVELHYDRHHTFKEIAAILGVTESRISQLHSALCARLAAALDGVAQAA